jgi:two-component system NtrC family response regulator
MTGNPPIRELLHPALDGAPGAALEEANLNDRQRMAVVLQAAALVAHLERGGQRLAGGWDGARVTEEGVLKVGGARPGRSPELPQVTLRGFLRRVFHAEGERIAGRGESRRVARLLAERWRQALAPFTADRAVADILDEATFLWQPRFAAARLALLAEHRVGGRGRLWLAGPGAARRRILAAGRDRPRVEERLCGAQARDLWEGWRPGADPRELAERGQARRAVAIWRRDPPAEPPRILLYARCLFALGRYSRAIRLLKDQKAVEARILRAWCQHHLGELDAAQAAIRGLAGSDLTSRQTVELAEVAIRVLGARGRGAEIRRWIGRLAEVEPGRDRLRAAITAAGAAWDLEDLEAMDVLLEEARAAREDPELAGKWHHVRGLRSIAVSDGLGAVEHVSAALRLDRRRLLRAEAGRLWNDLAIGRAYADDLAGAERACRHSLRLLGEVEGPSSTTLASYNLAEVRVRRGRVAGVEKALEASTAENRRAGNHRSLIRDLELWVRFELAQGRASAALARCAEARQLMESWSLDERRPAFEVLAARAHGWLGRRTAASACLERVTPAALRELEVEERPAVWALAGMPRQASDEAARTPWESLWAAIAAGTPPPPETWAGLGALEPFRGARLVFDCELALPGSVPPSRIREAVIRLRRAGAEALADRLEHRSLSPWKALRKYFAEPVEDYAAMARMLAAAGYGEVRMCWRKGDRETVLIDGRGGGEELSETLGDGTLVLSAPLIDTVLEALFALFRRDARPLRARPRRSPRQARRGDVVGESPAILEALERLDLLAQGELPILILGESGTGKELFARQAHRASTRASKPFLAVNCAALPETLIQPDLFGHVRGSFTGADRDREGVFETARGGTVFLDEIGDLPINVQGQLLRVLQEGEIRRVGESFARKVDVRIVAATHRDLEQMVGEGTFRQDLFYRLKVAAISVPPLRRRGDDVLRLADFFLARIEPGAVPRLSESARARLISHPWPGNVRELHNVLEVAAALSDDGEVREEHLDLPLPAATRRGEYHQLVDAYRKKLIVSALAETEGNRAGAARNLGLTRQALAYLVRRLGLI